MRTSGLSNGGHLRVVGEIADVEAFLLADGQVRIGLQVGDIGRIGVRHDIAFAGLQLLRAHGGIGGDGEDQVVDRLLAAPVVRVGLVADDGILLVVDERGTGPCRRGFWFSSSGVPAAIS